MSMHVAFATSKVVNNNFKIAQDEFIEKREYQRTSALDLSEILLVGDSQGFACMVHDLSESGAKLEVSCGELPEKFILANHIKLTRTLCKIVWRNDNFIGVRFLTRPRPMPVHDALKVL